MCRSPRPLKLSPAYRPAHRHHVPDLPRPVHAPAPSGTSTSPMAGPIGPADPTRRDNPGADPDRQLGDASGDTPEPLRTSGRFRAERTDTPPVCRLTAIRQRSAPQTPHMAPSTPDELRRQSGANVDPNTGGYTHGATTDDGEAPIRHLVIFARLSRPSALRPFRPAA
jgi:hypothetical protein